MIRTTILSGRFRAVYRTARLRLAASLFALGLLTTGCSDPGLPEIFAGEHEFAGWELGPTDPNAVLSEQDPGVDAANVQAEQESFNGTGTASFLITNEGTPEIQFLLDYKIEMKIGDRWTEVPSDQDTRLQSGTFALLNGESLREEIELRFFDSGTYRLVKKIGLVHGKDPKIVYAPFTVERQPVSLE